MRSLVILITGCLVVLFATSALAKDMHRFAYSEKMGVEIFAEKSSEGIWCADHVDLIFKLKENSPLHSDDQFKRMMSKIGKLLGSECESTNDVSVTKIDATTNKKIGFKQYAYKKDNWALVPKVVSHSKSTQNQSSKAKCEQSDRSWAFNRNTPSFDGLYLYEVSTISDFNYEQHALRYMELFHNGMWWKSKSDEFLRQEQLPIMAKEMETRAAQASKDVNSEIIFTYDFNAKLGEYDFSKSMFPAFNKLPKNLYCENQKDELLNTALSPEIRTTG